MPNSNVFNMDCLEYMKTVPDKYYDLLIADPPYGGGADTKAFVEKEKGAHFTARGRAKKYAEILNGSSQSVNVERERERATRRTARRQRRVSRCNRRTLRWTLCKVPSWRVGRAAHGRRSIGRTQGGYL